MKKCKITIFSLNTRKRYFVLEPGTDINQKLTTCKKSYLKNMHFFLCNCGPKLSFSSKLKNAQEINLSILDFQTSEKY